MSDIAESTDGLNADVYKLRSSTADKLLKPDGAIEIFAGNKLCCPMNLYLIRRKTPPLGMGVLRFLERK